MTLKHLTGRLLDDALKTVQSGQQGLSMEKYFRTAEYILLEAKEYVDGACEMIDCNKYNASLTLSRWVLEASMNLLWAVADKDKTEQHLNNLVGEALGHEANLNEGKTNLWPEHASVYASKANNARKMRHSLGCEKPASLRTRINSIKDLGDCPKLYDLYKICCSSAHPSLRVWERFRNIGNVMVPVMPDDKKKIACWMVAASVLYLVFSVYCLTELGDVHNLEDWWSKQMMPLLNKS